MLLITYETIYIIYGMRGVVELPIQHEMQSNAVQAMLYGLQDHNSSHIGLLHNYMNYKMDQTLVQNIFINSMCSNRWKCFRKWRSKLWHMVWLLLVLIYTHTVHTSMSILNCPSVPFNGTQAGVSRSVYTQLASI